MDSEKQARYVLHEAAREGRSKPGYIPVGVPLTLGF